MYGRVVYLIIFFSFFLQLSVSLNLFAHEKVIYRPEDDKSAEEAMGYSRTEGSASRYLGYRDIHFFIRKYVRGKKALDDGTGVGLSTRFLQDQGLDVTGVDVSKEMLAQSMVRCPNVPFHLVEDGSIPLASGTYDLVFSGFVLFELGSKEEILTYLNEAKRVIKEDGVLIAVTGSQDMYSKDWFLFDTDYPENKELKSGGLARIYLREAAIEFTDYYWTEADYRRFFKEVGFQLLEVHYPLGREDEPYPWKEEKTNSPYVVFVAKKSVSRVK